MKCLVLFLLGLLAYVSCCPRKEELLQQLTKRINSTVRDGAVKLQYRREYTKKAMEFVIKNQNNSQSFIDFHSSQPSGSVLRRRPNFRIYWLNFVDVLDFFECYANHQNGSDIIPKIFDVGFTEDYKRGDEAQKKKLIWWAFGKYGQQFDEMYESGKDPRLHLPKVKKDIIEALRGDCQMHTKRSLLDSVESLLEESKKWQIPVNESQRAEYISHQIELATREEARQPESKILDLMREYYEEYDNSESSTFDPAFFIIETEELYIFFVCNGMARHGHIVAEEIINLGFSEEYKIADREKRRKMVWDLVFQARSDCLKNATKMELTVHS